MICCFRLHNWIQIYWILTNIYIFSGERNTLETENRLRVAIASSHISKGAKPLISIHNHRAYALIHNYSYFYYNEQLNPSRPPQWAKISIIRHILALPRKFDWLLWLDSDAIILKLGKSVENILDHFNVSINVKLVFSGDTNAMNTGVMLLRRSDWVLNALKEVWDIGETLSLNPKVGMGYDNAAFSMFLAGCNSSSSYEQLRLCFNASDLGATSNSSKLRIENADPEIYRLMLSPQVLTHVLPVPHKLFNCYRTEDAKFVVHFAGYHERTKSRRMAVAMRRVTYPNHLFHWWELRWCYVLSCLLVCAESVFQHIYAFCPTEYSVVPDKLKLGLY